MSKSSVIQKQDDKHNENKNSFWNFPAKISNLALTLIVVLVLALFALVIVFVLPKRTYGYYPEEKEITYAEKFNVYFKLYSNYTYSNEKLSKSDNLVVYYMPIDKTKWQPQITSTNIIAKTKDNTLEYLSPQSELPNYITSIMQRTIYPNHKTPGEGIKNIHFRLGYNLKTFDEAIPTVSKEVLAFNEEILTLTDKELKSDNCNDFIKYSDIFTEFYANVVESTNSTTENLERKIRAKISISSSLKEKYHLDVQIYAVKGSECYELAGYYGLSCVSTPTTEMICSLPTNYNFDYIIAKAKFIDANGKEIWLLYKTDFKINA